MGFRHRTPKEGPPNKLRTPIIEDSDDPLVKQTLKFAANKGIPTCPLAVEKLAEELGATIISGAQLPSNVIGRVEINRNDNRCRIKINSKLNNHRKRFTIAHELGHFLKHQRWEAKDIEESDIPKSVHYNRSNEKGGEEWEANVFAAQLLMPEESIRNDVNKFE